MMQKCSLPVSVVIPFYRAQDTIRRALDSVMEQTCLPQELVVVDDCSGNVAVAMLRDLLRDYSQVQCQLIESKLNAGPGVARNVGWQVAGQPYVAFLDADDSWHPRKLEIQYEWMQAHPDVMLSGHSSVRYEASQPAFTKLQAQRVSTTRLLWSNVFSSRSIMVRRELPVRFDLHKRYMEDHWWLLSVVNSGYKVYRLDLPLAYIYKADYGASGLSSRLWRMEQGELDNYCRLRRQGYVGLLTLSLLVIYSLLKFFKRLLVSLILNKILKTS